MKKQFMMGAAMMVAALASAQENDTTPGILDQVRTDVGLLKNLKISGYVQVQNQWAEKQDDKSYKVPSAAGGDFAANQDNRLGVRRGRVKFNYVASPLTQVVVQVDATEKSVGLKDAYIKATEKYARAATLTAGVFNRPFGFEVEYSSSSRETPERSRVIQALFPQERDLGACVTLQAPKTSRFSFLKLDVAAIAGNGINTDMDRLRDYIGRLNFSKSFLEEKIKVSGGASYYWGGFANQTTSVYSVGTNSGGAKAFVADTKSDNLQARSVKELVGGDLQVSVDAPWGLLTIRGEYVQGQQPTSSEKNVYPTAAFSTAGYTTTGTTVDDVTTYKTVATTTYGDTYMRNMRGYYVYVVQNILQTRHQLVFKYDYFDPNTDVEGSDIDGKNLYAADIAFSTVGVGYIVKLSPNLKMMLYGDIVKNENTKIAATVKSGKTTDPGWETDRKDNVLTLRLQYKF